MAGRDRPAKKSNACVPCHQRKVRCDSAVVGMPCSRCISKNRVPICNPITRKPRSSDKRSQKSSLLASPDRPPPPPPVTTSLEATSIETALVPLGATGPLSDILLDRRHSNRPVGSFSERGPQSNSQQRPDSADPSSPDQDSQDYNVSASIDAPGVPPNDTPYVVSEEDAHVQTLYRMGEGDTPTNIAKPLRGAGTTQGLQVFEYFDRLNSVSVLAEALGHRRRKRLVQIDLPGQGNFSNKDTELAGMDPADVAYLNSKNVFQLPPRETGVTLLRLFFEYIHPYTPVLDRVQFCEEFATGNCSHFLINAVFANVVPFAPIETLIALGYTSRDSAQRDFVRKAQLVHDFGCEKRQLPLLQGSIVLSSFQFSFAPNKDHRFWFINALRIATQMGLHMQNLGEDLDSNTHKLCRRIWWLLFTRDVLFSLSGFANARCMDDSEIDAAPLTEQDWVEEAANVSDSTRSILPPTTSVHKHYFIQNCQLAMLSAEFLRLSRRKQIAAGGLPGAMKFVESISSWRRSLPPELLPSHITAWSGSSLWSIILLAMSYRLECIFYRTAREHLRPSNHQEAVTWCTQQLIGATFELDTLINRAVVHNLVQYAPSALIVCALNLLAFHIEIALDPTNGVANKVTAKARIHACLSYLRAMSENWHIAKWSLRVSEWVVRRAGLALTDVAKGTVTPAKGQADHEIQSGGGQLLVDGVHDLDAFSSDEFIFSVDDVLPDHWMQDFLGESFFNQLDDEYLKF